MIIASLLLAVPATAQRTFSTDILAETFNFGEQTKKSVVLDDLHQECEYRDCIPSIEDPNFGH